MKLLLLVLLLAPVTSTPGTEGPGKVIVYARQAQQVTLFEGGREVASWKVSGHPTKPRPGRYRVYSKSVTSWSGSLRLDHMVRFVPPRTPRGKAIGFHAIPVRRDGTPVQTEAELGSFRSAGCVRQRADHALRLYRWADIGTPVVVTP